MKSLSRIRDDRFTDIMPFLYVHTLMFNTHKDGKCTLDELMRELQSVDKNVTRNREKALKYIDSIFVRGEDGQTIYLSSLRKMGNGHLIDLEPYEWSTFYAFRKALIKRTILSEKRWISYTSLSKRFGVCTKTIGKIVKQLVREEKVIVEENYILVNAGDRRDNGFKREKHLLMNSLRISNSYCENRNFYGGAKQSGNQKSIPGNPRRHYYFAQEVWARLGNDGPVENDVLFGMSRSRNGSALLYKALKRSHRYSEKKVYSGFR